MKSILQREKECFICKTTLQLEDHHIFGGPNRRASEVYGLKVWLCRRHHTQSREAVHVNRSVMLWLRQIGQRAFERSHTREEFMRIFHRNYLEEDVEDG